MESLAYVFWHGRRDAVSRAEYQSALVAFHDALRAEPPAGFRGSRVYAAPALPWLALSSEGYEDWYLLDDSAALDRLNEAAVSGTRQRPHDHVARMAAMGAAGLYRLVQGDWAAATPAVAQWFGKPTGESYPSFYVRLERQAPRGSLLWTRQMVLGPTPEFCLQTPERRELAQVVNPVVVQLDQVWG